MLIFRGLHPSVACPVALTIGNFDGMHLGHQALLAQLAAEAHTRGLPTAVVIFEPQPREFFTPLQAPARLTSLREKLELFAAFGVDRVHVCRFNTRFAQMSAADFSHALSGEVGAKFVLIGDDFRFGSGRSGDFTQLKKLGGQYGFDVQAMHSVLHDGVRISQHGGAPVAGRRQNGCSAILSGGVPTASAGAWNMAMGWASRLAIPLPTSS